MKRRCFARVCALLLGTLVVLKGNPTLADFQPLPLAGPWRFQLDRADVGVNEKWFTRDLADKINLPGILQAQGYGDEISTNTPWVLSLYDKLWYQRADYLAYTQPGKVKVPFLCQPPRHYLGAAWYQRDIEIPKEWEGRRVVLFLERTRWETRAWFDDKLIGTNHSLCTPHEFDFGIVSPGKHRLTVRVDNRMLMNYRPDAHAVSDSLGSTWNGIVGKIELRSTPLVWIDFVQTFPSRETKSVLVRGRIGNATGQSRTNLLSIRIGNEDGNNLVAPRVAVWTAKGITVNTSLPATSTNMVISAREQDFEMVIRPTNAITTWSEWGAGIQHAMSVELGTQPEWPGTLRFAPVTFRDFKTSGQEFTINGRPTHLRGTHHGGDFPLTGYPPCDVEYWRKLFQTCKEWGLNHVRFHSFCPPEAAFTAADEIGIYLQIEPGMWNEISPGTPMEQMLYEETERIIKYYGNHPSFVLMSASNEAKGRWKEACSKWVRHFRERDPRRLYTPDTGWSLIDEPGPVGENADYLAVHRIGQNMMRGERGWFGRDYARAMQGVDVPNIAHELGQWGAYPDFDVIKKFTGFIQPGNYEIFRDSAAANGVLEFNKQFAYASGRFQLACYKEEIEANLRTPGLGGFQLLDLHDYTGQGTALVGLLDPFWQEKGYVTADEWRRFCSKAVLLASLKQRIFTTAAKLETGVSLANYGFSQSNTLTAWTIFERNGKAVTNGFWRSGELGLGRTTLGAISLSLSQLKSPAMYRLHVSLHEGRIPFEGEGISDFFGLSRWRERYQVLPNDWNFWLYPAQVSVEAGKDVFVTSSWNDAEKKLVAGGKVLFLPRNADLDWSSPPLDNLPVFWNRLMNPQWGRMLGLWCDTNHPALAGFPTEANCDWQWTQITKGTRAVNIGKLPRELKPIVAAIDDWNRNWKLAPIFEAKVGKGKLLVCSFDLTTKLDDRIVARQLRRSLLDYAASDEFQPATSIPPEQMRSLWFDSLVMRKLGATADNDARAAFDGDPNTFWSVGGGRGNARRHPHELTIAFTNAVAMSGVTLMNRQNDRDHTGDIRSYKIELSEDGSRWRQVAGGELPSTWNPQTLKFARTETAKKLKLTALSGSGNDSSAALAEIAVLYAGPLLPENSDVPVEYRRVRSTSSDVDEGMASPPVPRTNN